MRKNWKRILAAVLAACMIFCDSSLVYAVESQPIVEASETETEVEATEIGDETILPEATEEEVITEEPAEEADEAESVEETEEVLAEEETVVEEPTEETDLEEFLPEEEKEVVEIEPVTEVISVEQMNTATGNTILTAGEKVTVTGSDTRYVETFDFTATESGKHCLYVDGTSSLMLSYIQVYEEDGTTIDYSINPETCYDLDVDAEDVYDVVRGYILEEGTTYKINVQGSVATGENATFWFGKVENEPIQLIADSNTETIKATELKMYTISEEELQTGGLFWTGNNPEIYISSSLSQSWEYTFNNSARTEGQRALIVPAGATYYVTVRTTSDSIDTNITWKHVDAETISIGETGYISTETNGTPSWKFYEFEPDVEKDYLISANGTASDGSWNTENYLWTAVILEDGSLRAHKATYTSQIDSSTKNYGEDYTDAYGNTWLRVQFPENCKKFYICAYQYSEYWQTAVYLDEIIHPVTLTPDKEKTIEGADAVYEYEKWHEITPEEDTYYYLDSDVLSVTGIAIWDSEGQYYSSVEPDFFCMFKPGTFTYTDVVKCYKLEKNITYGVRLTGTIPTEGTSFIWKTTNESYAPGELNFGESKKVTSATSPDIYEISEDTHTVGILTYSDYGFGNVGFFGDFGRSMEFEEGTQGSPAAKKVYAMIAPAGKKTYITASAMTDSTLTWEDAQPTMLTSGYEEIIAPTVDTIKYYEFIPNATDQYQLLVQGDLTQVSLISSQGDFMDLAEETTDDDGNTWLNYSNLSDIDIAYVLVQVNANSTGRIVFKQLSTAVDEDSINDTLTVNQVVSVSGGENGVNHTKGYTFIPEASGYYYLESDVLRDYSYAVYDESTGYYDYSPNLSVRCVRKDNATTIKDIVTSHYFEAGKSYLVYITGTVSANSFVTFTWKECTAPDDSTEVYLDGEPINVPGGEISIYKLHAEETTVANVLVNGWDFLEVYGDNYKGLPYGYTVGDTKQHENVMAVGKGKTYYYVLAPTEDATITFKEEVTKTIKPDEEFKVEASSDAYYDIVCHEFTPKTGAKYEVLYDISKRALAIMEKDGNLSWVTEGTITDSDGKLWTEINVTDNIEKVYLFTLAEAGTPQMVALKSDTPTDPYNITLNTFDGSINVPAGETVTVTYEGPHLGDYFITRGGVNFKSTYVGSGLKAPVLYTWLGTGQFYTYSFADNYDVNTTDTAKFTFTLENTTEYNQSISIGNSLESYTWDSNLDEDGNLIWSADMETEKEDFYASYYRFTADETTVYSHPEIAWVMRVQDANGNNEAIRWDKYELEDGKIILNAGETYIFKFISNKSDDDADWYSIPAIYEETYSTTSASSLFYDGEDDYISVYHFTPMLSGRYSNETKDKIVTVWEQNVENGTWTKVSKLADSATGYADYELSAEKEYLVVFDESTLFALKSNVTVLDYDYYDTFVNTATGGSISIDTNGKVTITPKSKGAKLVAKICSILGIADYSDEDTLDELKDGNAYWKGFVPKKLYKFVDKQLVENVEGIVEDGDVVVVKYEPEVVWVHSMTVTADKTVMNIDDESQIHVAAKAATTKYPLDNPIFTYVSSNPEIVSVDKDGKMTALAAGKVKITVMADVAARFEEGCSNKILKKDIWVTVSQRFNINYENLFDANGESIGLLNESNPTEYNTLETTDLGVPTAVEGYDFVGWYSDEAQTKKITSIAKGSTGDKTIYAKWKLHDYNINYELGDGKFATDANQPTTFTMDKETVLVDPILQGYALEYWYWLKEDAEGELYEEELLYNMVKENPEDPESPETKIWYIPTNVKEDVQIFAKWKFDTEFSLAINGEKDEDGNVTITHPYNSATGEWNLLDSSFVVQSDTEGIVPEYYNDGVLSVSATLMKYNEDSSMFEPISSWDSYYDRYEEYEFYRVTDLMADDIEAPGKYRLEVNYTHPGQDMQHLEQEFTVNYAKREYPVNKEVSWSALSNVDCNRTYSMIASEIANKMQPNESVFREDKGEEKLDFAEDLVNVIFKDSRNRVVKNTAKVTSGTYTVVLEFAENDRFLTEATGTVNISYGTIASAGVQYLSAETLEEKDYKGRIPGSTIAFEIPELDEDGNPVLDDRGEPSVINTTPYVNGVQIDPIVKVPWSTEAIPVAALEASLEANGYHGYTVSVGVTDASRKEFLSFSEVTSAITEEVVAYIVTGKASGKANIVFETTITDSEGNEVAVIPTTIKNFTVVNGGADAVETITFDLYKSEEIIEANRFAPKETDAMGVKTYLIEKDDVARTYWLDVEALNYEGDASENVKLTWKSSNNKLAAVKTAKDGTVTLTIPKNAQGVVDVTVTANDVTKKSQSMKFVIADTSMRLDTTSLTMNSKFAGDSAIAYLYPNVLSSEIEGVDKESLFGNTITVEGNGYDRIAIYKKVGKSDYEKSEIFNSFYDLERGELIITFKYGNYPVKATTHNVYVGILHEEDIKENPDNPVPSERYALKIKDTCALPKAPSLKVTKNYEVVYKEGWAELTVTLKSRAAHMQDENGNHLYDDEGNWRPAIQTTDKTKFEVVAWEDLSYGHGTTWKLKLQANDESVLPAANQKKKVTNVEFVIGYDGYRQDEDALAKTKANITAVRTIPTLPVYGEDAYAPVYYTDADYRYVDVVIPVPKELIEGMVNENSADLILNYDSSGAILNLGEDKELEIILADAKPDSPSKFEVYEAEIRNYYFEVPGKKDSVEVEHAIAATVIINNSQKKNVNLQFNVRSSALEDGVTITTKALTIKPRTIKSESISLIEWNTGKTIKSLNFNSNYAGKESIEIEVMKPVTLSSLSESNGFESNSHILVEAADKNTQKMLQNNELLVEVDEYGDVFKVTSTNDSFKYKSAKLKITMVANEETGNPLKTKSTTLAVNFKKALKPKITISNAKLIRGLNVHGKGFEHAEYWGAWTETKVKYMNMPVGAEVIDIRFADQADYTKYFDPYEPVVYESVPDYLYIEARPDAKLSLGKDAIGLIYDVRTATGEVISIPVTLNLTIADNFSLKADMKSINLYNTAVGKEYGKYVRFYDTKCHAVEVLEIINAEELKKAGINFDLTAETEEDMIKEQDIEYFGDDAVKFYVDDSLKRGIEKTYTVKAKVAVVDSAVKENGNWTTTTATEKTLTFKIVLKK